MSRRPTRREPNMDQEKREIPSPLKKILAIDVSLSETFVKYMDKIIPQEQKKTHCKVLEISCHGIVWITALLAFIWILNNKNLYQMQVNLLIGLILDIIFVALLKAVTRRRRPAVNDDVFSIGPDKYSFPSGHASRACFILYFFANLWPVSSVYIPFLLVWCICINISRVLMKRHHILDVCLGSALGVFEGILVHSIYLESETCVNLISWITDEKLDGPEYDV